MGGLPAESIRCVFGTVVGHAPAASVDREASVFRVELHSRSITRLDANGIDPAGLKVVEGLPD
jgi:hypothetical protein